MRNSRRGAVDPFIVMDVMAAAAAAEDAGRHVIHMEVGQPGTPAPAAARAALSQALESNSLGYTVALGLPALRARIAEHYLARYRLALDPARVIVTAGASGAFLLAFTALFDAGDRVGLGLPGYPSYRQILKALSLTPLGLAMRPENGFRLAPEDLPWNLAGLILASPNNPTGTILSHRDLAALIHAASARNTAVISDEIYHGLDYCDRAVSALEVSDDVFVINSFSKYFSMTGWRVGWMVVPQAHVRQVERLAQNLFICAPHASQVAALAALDAGEECEANKAVYAANRDVLLAGLSRAGLTRTAPPDGAFYAYVDVSDLTDDSRALSRRILDEADVAVTPGLDFDPERGHRYLRLSYAGRTVDIEEGTQRLVAFFNGLRTG